MKTTHIKPVGPFILPVLFMLALLGGCKKENNNDTWPTDTPLLKMQYVVSSGVVTTKTYFYYDNQNRLSMQVDSLLSGDTTSAYLYRYTNTTTVQKFGYGPDTSTYSTTNYTIDTAGRIAGNNYDAEGHMVGVATIVYEWADGNLQRVLNGGNVSAQFTYDIGKRNTIDKHNKGIKLYGTDSKNPVILQVTGSNPTQSFTYKYDADGRITERTSQTGEVYHYTYM